MAYVTGFDHDVFVSYATVDDIPSKNGWVAAFVKHLREELNSAFGVRAENRVWWDSSHIDGEENLPDHIRKGVQKSACLVAILSRGYVSSNWCRAEREAFFQAVHVKAHPEERIFLIDIGNLPFAEKPVEFGEFRARDFWQQDTVAAEEGHRIRIGHPVPGEDNPDHRNFFSEVNRLAKGIAKRTRRLAKEIDRLGTLEKLKRDLEETLKKVSTPGFQRIITETQYCDHHVAKSEFCRWLIHDSALIDASYALNEVLENCDPGDVDNIGALLDCLLPLRYCDDLQQLQESMMEKNLRLVEQRAGDASIAEIIMAGIDCRPADSAVRIGREAKIIGRTALEIMETPEVGPEDRAWSVQHLLQDLVQQFAGEFQGTKDKGSGTVQALATQLTGWLVPYSKQKKKTVYGLIRLPKAGPPRSDAIACLQEVCNLVPKLAFVEIVSREEEADQHEASILHVIRCRQRFRKS